MKEWLNEINQYFGNLEITIDGIYSDLNEYITFSKVYMITAFILLVLLVLIVWALNTKVARLTRQNEEIQNKLNDILLHVGAYKKQKGENINGSDDKRSNEGNHSGS